MNKPNRVFILLLIAILFVSLGTVNTFAIVSPEANSMRNTITDLMKKFDVKSSAIVVVKNGEIVLSDGFGKESVLGADVSEKSVFEAGSNGKMIAAYITLKLADDGKLNLDDKITQYLSPDWTTNDERFEYITVRELLSHTAGFSPSFELGIDKNIYFDPGTQFSYSGVGYIYLQQVIETVTGEKFETVAQSYVFAPLAMTSSTFQNVKTVTPFINTASLTLYCLAVFLISLVIFLSIGFVIGAITKYKRLSKKRILSISIILSGVINIAFLMFLMSKLVVMFVLFISMGLGILFLTRRTQKMYYAAFPIFTSIIVALGLTLPASLPVTRDLIQKDPNCAYSLKTTAKDMALFVDELLIQSKNYSSPMFTPQIVIDKDNGWGLGIAIEKSEDEITYWHSGINPGFQSLVVLYPKNNSYIVILTNSDNGLSFSKAVATEFLAVNGTWDIIRTELTK